MNVTGKEDSCCEKLLLQNTEDMWSNGVLKQKLPSVAALNWAELNGWTDMLQVFIWKIINCWGAA